MGQTGKMKMKKIISFSKFSEDKALISCEDCGKMHAEGACMDEGGKPGLWANIHKRRKAGKAPKKPGDKGYPKTLDIEATDAETPSMSKEKSKKMLKGAKENYESAAQRMAVHATKADDGKGHPDNKKKLKAHKVPGKKTGPHKETAFNNVTYDKNGRVVKEAKTRHTAKSIGLTINKVAMHGVDDLVKKIDGMEPQGEYGKKMRARRARSDRDIAQAKKEAAIPTMMVTRPGAPNEPIKISATEWPSFKARGYHHAEQKENLNLINKIKKSGVAKGSMGKDDDDAERKRAGNFQAGLDKVKADMKARQAARKANTDESVNEEDATEALDMKQRLARGRSARKNKAKLAMGRKRAGRRIASMPVLKKRAQRAARRTMTKRLTKGVAKTDLSPARKKEIEKRLDKPAFKTKINRLVKRTIKDIRKAEIARKRK